MSAELVLKAFILSRKEPIEGTTLKTHNLIELYAKCQQLGLKFCADETRENKNVMMYLHRGNENQGFRYFSTSSVEPDVRWSHDVVNRIVQIIGEELRPLDVEDLVPVRLVFIMEGPRPKDA